VREKIPGLVNVRGEFGYSPVAVGTSIFSTPPCGTSCAPRSTSSSAAFAPRLVLDHVNGHLHMHMHPVVFGILMADAETLASVICG